MFYKALRPLTAGGQKLDRGDVLDAAGLNPRRIQNLVEQRYLAPVDPPAARQKEGKGHAE